MLWRYSRRDTKVLLLATLLVFSGYAVVLGQSWQDTLVRNQQMLLAESVGVLAAVPENEMNTYSAALDERSRQLDEREKAMGGQVSRADTTTLWVVTVGGMCLFGLILLNFYFDHKRRLSM